jgi:hypothetical protein
MPFPLVVVSCAACRERALELSGLSSLGVCAGVRPEELNQLFRPLLTCVVLYCMASLSRQPLAV